jgi:beta-glucosidase
VYVTDEESSLPRPLKELKAFEKVLVGAGQSVRVDVELDRDAFAFYDPAGAEWVIEKGQFGVIVGGTSADVEGRLEGGVEVAEGFRFVGL